MFSWSPVDGAVRYELWVTHVELNARLIHETNLTSLTFTPAAALPLGTYRAWVRAVSVSGQVSAWSVQTDFVIAAVESLETDIPSGSLLPASLQSLETILPGDDEAFTFEQSGGAGSDAQDWVIAASMKLRNPQTGNDESWESIGLTRTTGLVNPVRTKLDVIVTPAELDEAVALDPEMLFLDQHRLFDESHQI